MSYEIYCITNKLNNKSYVGQSIDAKERWKDHIHDAKRIIGKTATSKKFAIHNAINKYGEDNFIWQIIDKLETIEEANEAEEFYIFYLETLSPNGYNLQTGGKNKRPSKETKNKISKKLKITGFFIGKKGGDHPNFGTHLSDERKQQQSEKLSGDNGPGKKINSEKAIEIYLDYLNNPNSNAKELSLKYNLGRSTISNILNKKSWKEVLKDLPNINIAERTRGENWIKSKLKEQDILNICIKYQTGNYTQQQLANEYHITNSAICNIIKGKSWKHIKRQ